jgi:hypothetical protein
VLRRELDYCMAHPEEMSRVAAVQAKVDEVKNIMVRRGAHARALRRGGGALGCVRDAAVVWRLCGSEQQQLLDHQTQTIPKPKNNAKQTNKQNQKRS